jgi:hypothetical protein
MPLWIRPHLIPPTCVTTAITAANLASFSLRDGRMSVEVATDTPDAWILSSQTVDGAGQVVDALPASLSTGTCAPRLPGSQAPAQTLPRHRPSPRAASRRSASSATGNR